PGMRQPQQLLSGDLAALELESVAVEHVSGHANRVVATGNHYGVTILDLHRLQAAFDQEIVQIECRTLLASAQQADVDVTATRGIDAPGPQQETEHRIRGHARI